MRLGHRWTPDGTLERCIFCGCHVDRLPKKDGSTLKVYRKNGLWTPDRPECHVQ